MSLYTFKKFTIVAGGTPQPLVGTTLTAATVAAYSPQNPGVISVAVTDSSVFDIESLGVGSGTIKTPAYAVFDVGSVEERVPIIDIPDATHIRVPYLENAHANSKYVRCAAAVAGVYVQTTVGNAAAIYIGTRPTMVKASFKYCVALLSQVASGQPVDFSDSRNFGANASQISDLWVDGTTGDGYLPSFGVT